MEPVVFMYDHNGSITAINARRTEYVFRDATEIANHVYKLLARRQKIQDKIVSGLVNANGLLVSTELEDIKRELHGCWQYLSEQFCENVVSAAESRHTKDEGLQAIAYQFLTSAYNSIVAEEFKRRVDAHPSDEWFVDGETTKALAQKAAQEIADEKNRIIQNTLTFMREGGEQW